MIDNVERKTIYMPLIGREKKGNDTIGDFDMNVDGKIIYHVGGWK